MRDLNTTSRLIRRDSTSADTQFSRHTVPTDSSGRPSRTAPGELGHDRPGQARKGAAHTAFVPHTDPHERELAVFARELSAALEAAVLEHRLGRWSLIASSPFLGRLRAELGERSAACLDCHVDRDLTTFEGAELESRVSALLPPPPPAP